MKELIKFIDLYTDDNNKELIEAIQLGMSYIFESYADVIDYDRIDSLTQFNRNAAMYASSMGNNILSFLQNSGEQLADRYSIDDEPELDGYDTINNYSMDGEYVFNKPIKNTEKNLGLTADDLKRIGF
jgi:hypothetical protein